MSCPHRHGMLSRTGQRYRFFCHGCDRVVTARQVGLNPRALGTNPRATRWRRRRRKSGVQPSVQPVATGRVTR